MKANPYCAHLAALAKEWRHEAAVLRRRGAEPSADALESAAEDLEYGIRMIEDEELTLDEVLEFPGTEEAEDTFPSVKEPGNISGVLVRIGGIGDQVWALLESEGEQIARCHTDRHTAKRLAPHIYEPIQLNGQAYWMRDAEGEWNLKHFRIDGFRLLEDTTLSEALTKLRATAGGADG